MMRPLLLLLVAASVFAQETDPITDKMRYEIAAAQRDFVIVKGPYDKALAQLQSKIAEADKACGGKFDPQSFACVNKEK